MSAATIPMSGDVSELIGESAQYVENRSLLLDKFVFHKQWPVVEEQTRRGRDLVKWDEASRWSFLRIADGAEQILRKEAAEKRRRADGNNVEPANRERYLAEARIADSLAGVKWDGRELASMRAAHTRRFISLSRSAYGDRAAITIGQLEGRLAINLAASLIQNAGICLDRLFGLPYIPGSAIKGVSRHAALEELRGAKGEERQRLFAQIVAVFGCAVNDFEAAKPSRKPGGQGKPAGDFFPYLDLSKPRDQRGALSFLPAYPVNEARVVVDLTNVHYPEYYHSGRTEDLSKENPRPNPFPVVESGAQFAFCLVLNGVNAAPELLRAATRWLEAALTIRGLGAKTAAGYGWFSLKPEVLAKLDADERLARGQAEAKARAAAEAETARLAELERLSRLSPEDAAVEVLLALSDEQFASFAKELPAKSGAEQHAFLSLLSTHRDKRERWKTWKKKKPDLAKVIESIRAVLNLPPLP